MTQKTIATLVGIICFSALFAQQKSFTLAQAQQYAVEHAYSVETSALEVEKSRRMLRESIAQGLPQIYANADWTSNINLQSFIIEQGGQLTQLTMGTPYSALGTISAEQLIFDASYIIAVNAGQVLEDNSQNELEKSEITIKEEVAKAYHLVLVSNKAVEIIKDNLVFISKNYDESKKMFEAGFMEEIDVDQLELIEINLKNQLDYSQKQANIAMMLLTFQMGISIDEQITLTDDIEELMLFSQDGESLLNEQFDVQSNIDYRILKTQEEGQFLNLKNERAAFYPKLKFKYLYGHNIYSANAWVFETPSGTPERQDNVMQNFGLNLSVPLFQGGSRFARVQQAKISLQQVEIAKQQMNDNLKLQYAQAKAEYEYALNSYFSQKRNVEISRKIRDVNAKKFAQGVASSLEYTQTENQYQQSLSSAIEAANNVLDKKVKLERIIGKYNR